MSISFQQFKLTLAESNSLDQLNNLLEKYLAGFHISTFAYTYYSYSPSSLNKLHYDYCSKNLISWHNHYIEQGYEDIDSTLMDNLQDSLPLVWDVKQQLAAATNLREKIMRTDSIAYGVEKGVSIPIHGQHNEFAVLLLSQRKNQHWFDHYSEIEHELFAAAHYYHHYIKKQLLQLKKIENTFLLTKRALQILTLLAKQASLQKIANELNITIRTVNYHIQRFNKKLGTKNKYESIMKVMKEGLIN